MANSGGSPSGAGEVRLPEHIGPHPARALCRDGRARGRAVGGESQVRPDCVSSVEREYLFKLLKV